MVRNDTGSYFMHSWTSPLFKHGNGALYRHPCKKLHQIGVCLTLGNFGMFIVCLCRTSKKSHFSLLSFCTDAWTEMFCSNRNIYGFLSVEILWINTDFLKYCCSLRFTRVCFRSNSCFKSNSKAYSSEHSS